MKIHEWNEAMRWLTRPAEPRRFRTPYRGAGLVDHGPEGVRQGYGSRMTTEEILAFRDKHHTLTSKQVAEKLKGKQGPYGHNITEGSLKQAVFDAGKTGKYGRFILAGRTLKQLKEEAAKLPSGKKYLAEYNKTKNKDEALKVFRKRVQVALGNIAKDPDKRAIQRAKWAKTEKGAASIERSIAKQSIKDTAEIGNFNPGRKPEDRLFHALHRSSTQKGSRWKLVGKKPDKWTTETSRNAKFLDTKNNKIITLKGLEKYMNTTPDIGSYKDALRPFESKQELQKFLVNYKGKEYKLGNLLNERLWTGEDWRRFKEGTSEIVVNHPDKVKDNWWKGEVAYKDANMKLNDLERKFVTKMKRANNDVALENVIKNKFTKEIKKLGPITYKGPYGEFGTKPTSSALVKSMVKPLYKKTQDKALSRTLNTLVKNLEDAQKSRDALVKGKSGMLKTLGKRLTGVLGPTGIMGMTAGFGFDPKSAVDRMSVAGEAALAPELVKASIGATKGMKNRAAQKVVQQLLNLGMPTQTALRVARIASPLGLLTLGGEGLYHMYKKGHFDKERMMPSLMDEAAYEAVQKEKFDANQPMFAGGGLTRTVAPDSGPMSRGLSYLYNRARRK